MGWGIVCGLGAGALWGTVFLMPVWLAEFSPLELALGRYLAYGAIASVLMLPRLPRLFARLGRDDLLALLRHALSGNIIYYILLSSGVALAGVAPTSLIIGMLPLTVSLMGRADHGAAPLRQLAGPLLAVLAGMVCINADLLSRAGSSTHSVRLLAGVACALGALLCWTWYAVDNARFLKRKPQFSSAEWSALYGIASALLALLLGALLLCWRARWPDAASLPPQRSWSKFWLANGVLALGASVIGNHLWNIASRRVPMTLSGQLILSETVFALLYAFMYYQRWPRALELAALALLISGVVWAVRLHALDEPLVPE